MAIETVGLRDDTTAPEADLFYETPKASVRFSFPETSVHKDEAARRVWAETVYHEVSCDGATHSALVAAQRQAIAAGRASVTREALLLALLTEPRCRQDGTIRAWREDEELVEGLRCAVSTERVVFPSMERPVQLPHDAHVTGSLHRLALATTRRRAANPRAGDELCTPGLLFEAIMLAPLDSDGSPEIV